MQISIHAPSRERPEDRNPLVGIYHFNPRSLAGATSRKAVELTGLEFQSTLPRGSDLPTGIKAYMQDDISIHAPSRERRLLQLHFSHSHYFNPRSLAGATVILTIYFILLSISIHAPSRERRTCYLDDFYNCRFQSTLPRGSDQMQNLKLLAAHISIHAPSRERLASQKLAYNY